MPDLPFEPIRDWLLEQHSEERAPEAFLEAFAARLVESGVPAWRISTSLLSFDPTVMSVLLLWVRGKGARAAEADYGILKTSTYRGTPIEAVLENGGEVRARLGEGREPAYPVLRELADAGATDYVAIPLDLSEALASGHFVTSARRGCISYATDAPGGFTEAHLELLRRLSPALSLRVALETTKQSARSLLKAYLGRNAAARVLDGQFRRGSAVRIQAVIWYCDLRGFTALSDATPADEVVRILDLYFDAMATPIDRAGGEVLKFVGDAVLSIFPIGDGGPAEACKDALAATREARRNIAAINRDRVAAGVDPLGYGMAMHVGEVMYGNVGALNRLDFTVIGPPVNEACRVEALTRTLDVEVLLTDAFVTASGATHFPSLGRHPLKGVSTLREVFALPDDEPA